MDVERLRRDAQAAVLDGLRTGQTLSAIERAVAACRKRGAYEPDLAMLEVVIAALDHAAVGPDRPCDTGEWRASFLPEINFRNRHVEVERLTYALHTAAAFRTGLRPDVLDDTYGWGSATLLPYATRAAVMTVRAVAGADPLGEVCDSIA